MQEIIQMISADDITIHEYSDALTYRIIEQITILSKEDTVPFTIKQVQRKAGKSYCRCFSVPAFLVEKNGDL